MKQIIVGTFNGFIRGMIVFILMPMFALNTNSYNEVADVLDQYLPIEF